MAKRRRLIPLTEAPGPAPEVKSAPMRAAPIAQVAGEAAATHALQELTNLVSTARAEGRLIQPLPMSQIEAGHLVRDRLLDTGDEDMEALTASLRARGQQTPIDVVALEGGRFGLISGLRRLTALHHIGAETVLARIISPDTASDAYVAMIEENEVRADLSLYERARIVAKAVEAGVFPDTRDALLTLYASTPRAKRSKIKSVIIVVEALDDVLRFPKALSERACLDLARALEGDTGLAEILRRRLTEAAIDNPSAEAALLSAPQPTKPVETPQISPETENPAPEFVKNVSEKHEILGLFHSLQTDKSQEKREIENTFPIPPHSKEPIPGVYVQCQTDMQGQTRLIFSGPNVNNHLQQRINRWLREQEKGEGEI
jgi:ParB family chromosome partitioning protein